MRKRLLVAACTFFQSLVFAQPGSSDTTFNAHHTIGVVISHTQVSQGIQEDGKRKWLSLPSWAINYNYKFSRQWAVGVHNDIIIEDFAVESHSKGNSDKVLHRAYPVATIAVASYKPGKYFSFLGGAGGEFAHTGNLFLIRLGLEYTRHVSKKWELNGNIVNDFKINAYNSWALGLGVTYIL